MAEFTREQLLILRHAIGLDDNGRGKEHRNYFALYPESDGIQACEAMVASGLMTKRIPDPEIFGDMIYFHATEAGKAVARKSY